MTEKNPLNNQRGLALIFVLVAVTLLGLMAGIAGSSWQTIVQRAKEQELLWRGGQIRNAIGSYYNTAQGGSQFSFPANFEQLLKDPRFVGKKRHLRRFYFDPMTGDEWEFIKEPSGRIKGVRSRSDKEPFQKDNFSKENEKLAGKTTYAEWQFVYIPEKKTKKKPPGSKSKKSPFVTPKPSSNPNPNPNPSPNPN